MPTITDAGAIPFTPAEQLASITAQAVLLSPGLTANLPGSLVEDMASTAAGATVLMDQACSDAINSVSPLTANEFISKQLGDVYGVPEGVGFNTSVVVVFRGSPGFVINIGFIVGDGTHAYSTQDSAIIGPDSGDGTGFSDPVFCVALQSGAWAVPPNSVTVLQTSVPPEFAITVTNPGSGVPASAAQTPTEYRAQVIQAGQAVATGISTLVRTTVGRVNGVQPRLVSFRQTGGGWQLLVGGGDPYQVANALFQSLFDINDLQPASTVGTTQTIEIVDFPDTYSLVFVEPAQSTVEVQVTWNTVTTGSFVDPNVVKALVQPAMVAYVNAIFVGKPMSTLGLSDTFVSAVEGTIPENSLSELQFIVKINGTIVAPPSGGVLIAGDPEAYFFATTAGITVTKA